MINTQFEAWVNERFQGAVYLTMGDDGRYASPTTRCLLEAWEGSRAEQDSEISQLKAEVEALRKIISDSATACGAAVSAECTLEFIQHLPAEIASVVGRLRAKVASDEKKLDALLAHCDDGECVTCGQIICPHGDGMHFHHDGCPACAEHESATSKEVK